MMFNGGVGHLVHHYHLYDHHHHHHNHQRAGLGQTLSSPDAASVTLAIFKDQQSLNKITGQVIISEVNISPKNLYFFTDHKNGPA